MDHLRGRVARATAGRLEQSTPLVRVAESEVDYLDDPPFLAALQQEILRLEVAVRHLHLVEVLGAVADLFEERKSEWFRDSLVLNDVVEELWER